MSTGPLPATTTVEQNLRTASQRQVNLTWEYTQAGIAAAVVFANIVYAFLVVFVNPQLASGESGALLRNAFFLVIGFYFGRTNHARIGDDARPQRDLDDRPG